MKLMIFLAALLLTACGSPDMQAVASCNEHGGTPKFVDGRYSQCEIPERVK